MRTYKVVIEEDLENETYWARVPALPGCFTQGDTVAEVLDHLRNFIWRLDKAGDSLAGIARLGYGPFV